jgi:hypothetical protein
MLSIANLNKSGVLKDKLKNNEIITIVLPTIVKLFNEEGRIKEEAPLVLGKLCVFVLRLTISKFD